MSTTVLQAFAVGLGGAVGSLLRWRVSVWLNPVALPFAAGTLAVNCLGGLLIGFLMYVFERSPNDTLRLLLITGVLGGFTTFSAFSAESLGLLLRGQVGIALLHTLSHVLGALACAGLGWWVAKALLS